MTPLLLLVQNLGTLLICSMFFADHGLTGTIHTPPWATQGLTRNFTSDAHKVPAYVLFATCLLQQGNSYSAFYIDQQNLGGVKDLPRLCCWREGV